MNNHTHAKIIDLTPSLLRGFPQSQRFSLEKPTTFFDAIRQLYSIDRPPTNWNLCVRRAHPSASSTCVSSYPNALDAEYICEQIEKELGTVKQREELLIRKCALSDEDLRVLMALQMDAVEPSCNCGTWLNAWLNTGTEEDATVRLHVTPFLYLLTKSLQKLPCVRRKALLGLRGSLFPNVATLLKAHEQRLAVGQFIALWGVVRFIAERETSNDETWCEAQIGARHEEAIVLQCTELDGYDLSPFQSIPLTKTNNAQTSTKTLEEITLLCPSVFRIHHTLRLHGKLLISVQQYVRLQKQLQYFVVSRGITTPFSFVVSRNQVRAVRGDAATSNERTWLCDECVSLPEPVIAERLIRAQHSSCLRALLLAACDGEDHLGPTRITSHHAATEEHHKDTTLEISLQAILEVAASVGDQPSIGLLVRFGADVNYVNSKTGSVMHIAADHGHAACIEYLCSLGADLGVCKYQSDGATPLHAAASAGQLDAVHTLVALGADIECKLHDGSTPLLLAVMFHRLSVVERLWTLGANINAQRLSGETPLIEASRLGWIDIVEFLLHNDEASQQQQVNATMEGGATALYVAARFGHENIVKLLCEHSADPEKAMDDGATPMHAAAEGGYVNVLYCLSKFWAKTNRTISGNISPTFLAAKNGKPGAIHALVEIDRSYGNKPNVRAMNRNGVTPMYIAAQHNHPLVIEALVDIEKEYFLESSLHTPNAENQTPLMAAVCESNVDAVRCLVSLGADPNWKSSPSGCSAMDLAKETNNPEVLVLLGAVKTVSPCTEGIR